MLCLFLSRCQAAGGGLSGAAMLQHWSLGALNLPVSNVYKPWQRWYAAQNVGPYTTSMPCLSSVCGRHVCATGSAGKVSDSQNGCVLRVQHPKAFTSAHLTHKAFNKQGLSGDQVISKAATCSRSQANKTTDVTAMQCRNGFA